MAADGSLLLSDDTNGVIYRISYQGSETAEQTQPTEPTNVSGATIGMTKPEPSDASAGDTPDNLMLNILEAKYGKMEVRSPAFDDGEPIPATYAAEQQNISPPLAWSQGPEDTRSYVLMLEDPNVDEDPPFVHWTMYNIPADETALPEGVPGQPRLMLPEGALQGRNDRGSTGYTGMKPPQGDPAHHYHLQVFALDRELELPHGASRAELLDAMRGHVLAAGELVGTYRRS